VVIKELMDNALDACEEAELAPSIAIAVSPGAITVRDNGTGIHFFSARRAAVFPPLGTGLGRTFQQAETPRMVGRFLQIVAGDGSE